MPIRGVTWSRHNRRWRAVHSDAPAPRGYLGEFTTEEEATVIRRQAELKYDGYEHLQPTRITSGDEMLISLMGRRGRIVGWALMDAADECLLGGEIWCLSVSGYAVARIAGKIVFLHRLILPGAGVGDHVSGVKLDCRRDNLRLCTPKDNSRNRSIPKSNTTGYKGVTQSSSGDWIATICVDYKTTIIGKFGSKQSAARAYDAAARENYGEFARTNFL